MEDIDFWVDFVVGSSNKLQKLGLERKINWVLNVFTLLNLEIFNSKKVKYKNVFTHEPMAYATLVRIKESSLFVCLSGWDLPQHNIPHKCSCYYWKALNE